MIDALVSFMKYFNEQNVMEILLLLLIIIFVLAIIKLQTSNDSAFDLEDLVCHNGQLDEKKFTRFGAWVISTWGFVYIMIKNPNSIPEWYFVGYMGVWVTNVIFDRYVDKKDHNRRGSTPNSRYYDLNDRPPRNSDPER